MSKITVVTGEPRSGTSLMMQTLKHLGLDVAGEILPSNHSKLLENIEKDISKEELEQLERRSKHSEKMNPIGFYEEPGIVMNGVRGRRAEKYKGKVLKIITSGLPERSMPNGMKFGTDMDNVDKIILCLRNPKHIAVSQQDLTSNIELCDDSDEWSLGGMKASPLAYVQRTGSFLIWLDKNPEIKKKILVIDFDDMHLDSGKEIKKIVEFLDIKPSNAEIENAIGNVIPTLKRSSKPIEWDENFTKDGEVAMDIYASLATLDVSATRFIVEDRMNFYRRENCGWLDDTEFGTWINASPEFYRTLKSNDSTLQTLLKNTKNREAAGHICTKCKYYNRDGEEYIVTRPLDIGDLKRNKVKCARDDDEKTIEECSTCWEFGYNRYESKEAEMKIQK